jgi:hypothetical protein
LLLQAEAEVAAFVASLEATRREANRDGWHSLDDVMAEADHHRRETQRRLTRPVRLYRLGRREFAQPCVTWNTWSRRNSRSVPLQTLRDGSAGIRP